eukprot:208931-Karenia_brevis.AAC.2
MDYEVGRWVYMCHGKETGLESTKHCLGLQSIVHHVIPRSAHMLRQHHDAGCDAQLTRLVYATLLQWAKVALQDKVLSGKDAVRDLPVPQHMSSDEINNKEGLPEPEGATSQTYEEKDPLNTSRA